MTLMTGDDFEIREYSEEEEARIVSAVACAKAVVAANGQIPDTDKDWIMYQMADALVMLVPEEAVH